MGNLGDVKAGDEVIIENDDRDYDIGEDYWEMGVVQSVGDRTIVVSLPDGEFLEFDRETWGPVAGWGYEGEYPRILTIDKGNGGDVTPEQIEQHKAEIQGAAHREDLLCDIRDAYLDALPTAALERIAAIIEAAREEEPHA